MLYQISPVPHISAKKPTNKRPAIVLTSSVCTDSKQKLDDAKAEKEEINMKGGFRTPSTKKKQSLGPQNTADDRELCPHSCAECWEIYYRKTTKDNWIRHLNCSR
jgi:hypothetical protein